VAGDPAYVSRLNCTTVSKMGGIPRIYPKEGMTLRMKGSAAWTEMLLTLIETRKNGLKIIIADLFRKRLIPHSKGIFRFLCKKN
jgi:hypothetical protein